MDNCALKGSPSPELSRVHWAPVYAAPQLRPHQHVSCSLCSPLRMCWFPQLSLPHLVTEVGQLASGSRVMTLLPRKWFSCRVAVQSLVLQVSWEPPRPWLSSSHPYPALKRSLSSALARSADSEVTVLKRNYRPSLRLACDLDLDPDALCPGIQSASLSH